MTQNEFKTVVITAEEGKYLTQSFDVELLDRTVADTVALGKFDKVENWKEITKEEADSIREAQNVARKEQDKKADKSVE